MQIILDLICIASSLTGTSLLHTVLGRIIFLPLTLRESPWLICLRALQKQHSVLQITVAQRPSSDSGMFLGHAFFPQEPKHRRGMLSRLLGSL